MQREHETQWYAGRQELAMKIEARKVGQKKVDDVLYVPPPFPPGVCTDAANT
jgi:hypothetical protein